MYITAPLRQHKAVTYLLVILNDTQSLRSCDPSPLHSALCFCIFTRFHTNPTLSHRSSGTMSASPDLDHSLGKMSVNEEDEAEGRNIDEALGATIEEAEDEEHVDDQPPRDIDDQVFDALPPDLYVASDRTLPVLRSADHAQDLSSKQDHGYSAGVLALSQGRRRLFTVYLSRLWRETLSQILLEGCSLPRTHAWIRYMQTTLRFCRICLDTLPSFLQDKPGRASATTQR
ncbi:hypothetical protein OEA41_006073 [Lepraria neglecta]|uniref:Uncharacterized protein n=1 Tax=Lepraria neglecta TaxID=209136 RepID=A0AAE0DK60_9LECA|nr:hypothetical protein OEA41_006073 [Lepraria neglecta]